MKNLWKSIAAVVVLSLGVAACGGGGGTSTGGVYFTHAELAKEFVWRMNVDLGYDIELVKTNTEQWDYIVVYDYDYNSYDAYYIGNYNPGESLSNYIWDYEYDFYFDLDYIGGNDYQDWDSGIIFEKGTAQIEKDMMAVAHKKESNYLADVAAHLVQSYEMPKATAIKFAKASLRLQTVGNKASEQFYANVMMELTGSNLNDWKQAVKAKYLGGDAQPMEQLIEKTASSLGVSAADFNRVVEDKFGMRL